MRKGSQFEQVGETPYGPILQRKEPAFASEEPVELAQEEEMVESPSRRNFLRGAAAAAAAGVASAAVPDLLDWSRSRLEEKANSDPGRGVPEDAGQSVDERVVQETIHPEAVQENVDRFTEEVEVYVRMATLRRDEVLFVDKNKRPVGGPVPLQSFPVRRPPASSTPPEQIGSDGLRAYNLLPGHLNKIGIPDNGIPDEWLSHVKQLKEAENPGVEVADELHVVGDFNAAYAETDEPELVRAIEHGEITRYIDLVRYFAEKPVRGAEGLTRREYVSQVIQFAADVPLVVESELCRLLPGLCAQESKFNAGVKSDLGAEGIMQIMPKIWAHYGGEPGEYKSLKRQVEIAGTYLSDLYRQVQNLIGAETIDQLLLQFASEEAFQKDFLVPLILNSYNAGVGRVAEAVRLYAGIVPPNDRPVGRELFLAIADFAQASNGGKYLSGYQDDSREYVTKIYAQAEVLESLRA